jgi:hypothetical protein
MVHVGIKSALSEKGRAPGPACLLLEDVDEQPADGLALLLGIADARKSVQE